MEFPQSFLGQVELLEQLNDVLVLVDKPELKGLSYKLHAADQRDQALVDGLSGLAGFVQRELFEHETELCPEVKSWQVAPFALWLLVAGFKFGGVQVLGPDPGSGHWVDTFEELTLDLAVILEVLEEEQVRHDLHYLDPQVLVQSKVLGEGRDPQKPNQML